jgi:Domain of unknown function (DUF4177)
VHEHARDGWRLVQIFAPGVAAFGAAKYYELIFERACAEDATAHVGAGRERVASTAGHEVAAEAAHWPAVLVEVGGSNAGPPLNR